MLLSLQACQARSSKRWETGKEEEPARAGLGFCFCFCFCLTGQVCTVALGLGRRLQLSRLAKAGLGRGLRGKLAEAASYGSLAWRGHDAVADAVEV